MMSEKKISLESVALDYLNSKYINTNFLLLYLSISYAYIDWDIITKFLTFKHKDVIDLYLDKINWDVLNKTVSLNTDIKSKKLIDFCEAYYFKIDWCLINDVFRYARNDEFILRFKTELNWFKLSKTKLSLKIIEECKDEIIWHILTKYSFRLYDYKTIHKYKEYFDWNYISKQPHNSKFLYRFKNYLNWRIVSSNNKWDKKQLDIFRDKIDWGIVHINQSLDEESIIRYCKYFDYFDFKRVFKRARFLSTTINLILEKCKNLQSDLINLIVYYQDINDDFLLKYHNKFNWRYVLNKKDVSYEFFKKNKKSILKSFCTTQKDKIYQILSSFILISNREKLYDLIKEARYLKDKIIYFPISLYEESREKFIMMYESRNIDKNCWIKISMYQRHNIEFINRFKEYINWKIFSKYPNLKENEIRIFKNDVKWDLISKHQKLSEDFIEEFRDYVNWIYISKNQKLSDAFLIKFANRVDWNEISFSHKLSENIIRRFSDSIQWRWISYKQKLSESFIREFQDRVYWDYISEYQKLSEDFIREFQDKVNWNHIIFKNVLREEFIKEFDKFINWDLIWCDENESKIKFLKRYQKDMHRIGFNNMNKLDIQLIRKYPRKISWWDTRLYDHFVSLSFVKEFKINLCFMFTIYDFPSKKNHYPKNLHLYMIKEIMNNYKNI